MPFPYSILVLWSFRYFDKFLYGLMLTLLEDVCVPEGRLILRVSHELHDRRKALAFVAEPLDSGRLTSCGSVVINNLIMLGIRRPERI